MSAKSNVESNAALPTISEYLTLGLKPRGEHSPGRPKQPKVSRIVFFLHGYGSGKEDLAGIAPAFYGGMPETLAVVPNAPDKCDNHPSGYQWFPIINDYQTGLMSLDIAQCQSNLQALIRFITETCESYEVPLTNCAVFGFSQGGFMAMCLNYLTPLKLGAVVCHSGLFYNYNGFNLQSLATLYFEKKIPTLVIHGQADEVLSFAEAERTLEFLKSYKVEVNTYLPQEVGHCVTEATIRTSLDFIKLHLG